MYVVIIVVYFYGLHLISNSSPLVFQWCKRATVAPKLHVSTFFLSLNVLSVTFFKIKEPIFHPSFVS
ncbi:hypothetical protein V8C37DRAFT_370358 [Trichoderma ceciliae]